MVDRAELCGLLEALKAHVPKGRAPAVRCDEAQIDRTKLGGYRTTPGLRRGQLEDRRYPLEDGSGLHEHRHDGHSVFHLDRVDTSRGILRHYAADTRGPEAAATGVILGFACKRPVLGALIGAATGAFIPRGKLVVFDLAEARRRVR